MRRRDLVGLVAGTAVWPLVVRAQQSDAPRIGILIPATVNDAQWDARLRAFLKALTRLGWSPERTVRIETRWAAADGPESRRQASDLVALAPKVIVALGRSTVRPLLQATRTLPIVFSVVATNPFEIGDIGSLARPGGNTTGFMSLEYSLGMKSVELLKEIAPTVTRVALLRDFGDPSQTALFGDLQTLAPALRVEIITINTGDASEIEPSIEVFARSPDGGLFVTAGAAAVRNRDLIVSLAARHKLPAIYRERLFVAGGGLISYGADLMDQYRHAATYVDRILKGEKPSELPVQALTKFELVINLNTAQALGLTVPQSLLQRADEVIE